MHFLHFSYYVFADEPSAQPKRFAKNTIKDCII